MGCVQIQEKNQEIRKLKQKVKELENQLGQTQDQKTKTPQNIGDTRQDLQTNKDQDIEDQPPPLIAMDGDVINDEGVILQQSHAVTPQEVKIDIDSQKRRFVQFVESNFLNYQKLYKFEIARYKTYAQMEVQYVEDLVQGKDKYTGYTIKGTNIRHGHGTCIYSNGDKYEGE